MSTQRAVPLSFPEPTGVDSWIRGLAACPDAHAMKSAPDAGHVVDRDGRRVLTMHNGIEVLADAYFGQWMTRAIEASRGHFDPQREAAFAEVLRRLRESGSTSPSMLELGSYWCFLSMWFLAEFPAATVACVEADPRFLEVGRLNLELNGLAAAHFHGAVGPGEDPWLVTVPESDQLVHASQRMGQCLVHRFTIEELMDASGISTVDLMVVDVRGHEVSVLQSIAPSLASGAARWIIVTTAHHSRSGSHTSHQAAVELLTRTGATVVVDLSVSESHGLGGLVVATFDDSPAATEEVELCHARARDTLHGEVEHEAETLRLQLDLARGEAASQRTLRDQTLGAADELEVQLARAHGERDLLITQLAHARHQRDEAAKGLPAVVSRRSTEALRSLRQRVKGKAT